MKIFALDGSKQFGGLLAQDLKVGLSKHEEREFEDGEHKSRPLESVQNEDVFVVHSLYSDREASVNDKLCRLLFFAGALKDASARSVSIIAPYLCYARKDRKTKPFDPVTTRYVAQLFEAVGITRIITMDVHNIQSFQNAFRCPAENLEAKEIFANCLQMLGVDKETLVILSPDIGGIKRAEQFQQIVEKKLGGSVPLAFMEKYRSSGVVSGSTLTGDVRDKTVIILDDLIATGTTLIRTAAACRKSGAHKIFAFATHGLFTGEPDRVFTGEIDQIYVTNTVVPFRLEGTKTKQKVTVLDASPEFGAAISAINSGTS